MYILLLWGRYLRRRFLAWLCVVSVMLGVATLIVVNSVMSGFSTKLKDRLHLMLSDIVVESTDPLEGFALTADEMMERIRNSPAGPHVAAMSPTIETFALMQFRLPNGRNYTTRVMVIGIDPKRQKEVGGFSEHLTDPARRANPSFELDAAARKQFESWHRPRPFPAAFQRQPEPEPVGIPKLQPVTPAPADAGPPQRLPAMDPPPSAPAKYYGIVLGHAIAHYRNPETGVEECVLPPGDPVKILTVGSQLDPVVDDFVVCDYLKSEMSDYDGTFVYVPLDQLQRLRTMEGRCNVLQIRLKHYDTKHAKDVKETIAKLFPGWSCRVNTWEEKQGALLAAIDIERGILNLLLFMIIGVAGFGILAIFSMIVTEKTRDIGILKSLGASNRGVRRIFMGYGLLLGLVGAAMGTVLGLLITRNINEIEKFITRLTGHEVFDRKIYYFAEIPVDVQAGNVALIVLGAVAIAVGFSVIPALRASRLQPVRALRYE